MRMHALRMHAFGIGIGISKPRSSNLRLYEKVKLYISRWIALHYFQNVIGGFNRRGFGTFFRTLRL